MENQEKVLQIGGVSEPAYEKELRIKIELPEEQCDKPKILINGETTPTQRGSGAATTETCPKRKYTYDFNLVSRPGSPNLLPARRCTLDHISSPHESAIMMLPRDKSLLPMSLESETRAIRPTTEQEHNSQDNEQPQNSRDNSMSTNRAINTPESEVSVRGRFIGITLLIITSISIVGSAYLIKIVAAAYSVGTHEMLFLRGIHSILVSLFTAAVLQVPLFTQSRDEIFLILWRTLASVANSIFYYNALLGVSVSLISVAYCSLPLIVAVMARLFLKELIYVTDLICILFGVVGLVFETQQPAALFGNSQNAGTAFYICLVLVLCAMLCNGVIGIVSRKIKGRIDYTNVTLHYGIGMAIVEASIIYLFDLPCHFSVVKFFLVMALHTINYFAMLAFHYAHVYMSATNASFTNFIQAIIAVSVDGILGVPMNKFSIIGTVILFSSGIALTILKLIREKKAKANVNST